MGISRKDVSADHILRPDDSYVLSLVYICVVHCCCALKTEN